MDSKQFDELVARLAAGPSRRDALKGIVGGALASVGAVSVAESASKGGKKSGKGKQDGKKGGKGKKGVAGNSVGDERRRRRRRKKKCKLQPGQTRCSRKICVDTRTNSAHCGRCFNQCSGATPVCRNSVCAAYG